MLSSNSKCHEALFGLGRINYAQGRYDIAEKCLVKAYEIGRDFTYRVWLAFTQLQLHRVASDDNPKKLQFAENAFSNFSRCMTEQNVSLYAYIGLIELSLELYGSIKNLDKPESYALHIQANHRYEGQLMMIHVLLRNKDPVDNQMALNSLHELIKTHENKNQLAYLLLIRHLLSKGETRKATQVAEEAMFKTQQFDSF